VKIDRVGGVTIYQRGAAYHLYYRAHGESVRRKIDGSLRVARATAGQIVQTLAEDRPSMFALRSMPVVILFSAHGSSLM
jgi:hypothetical protein